MKETNNDIGIVWALDGQPYHKAFVLLQGFRDNVAVFNNPNGPALKSFPSVSPGNHQFQRFPETF
jgi:hypothetical protein